MQYDDRLQNTDPMRKRDDPLNSLHEHVGTHQASGKQPYGTTAYPKSDQDQINRFNNLSNNQVHSDQQGSTQASKQNDNTLRAQENLGNIGSMLRDQESLSEWQANANKDPRNPYGKIDDLIADYNNQRSIEPYQQCW